MDIKKLNSQNIWANKRSPFSSYSWSKGLPGKEDFEERRSFITLRNNGLQKHLPRLHYLGGRLKMLQHQQLDLPGVSCQFNLSPCTISIKRKKKNNIISWDSLISSLPSSAYFRYAIGFYLSFFLHASCRMWLGAPYYNVFFSKACFKDASQENHDHRKLQADWDVSIPPLCHADTHLATVCITSIPRAELNEWGKKNKKKKRNNNYNSNNENILVIMQEIMMLKSENQNIEGFYEGMFRQWYQTPPSHQWNSKIFIRKRYVESETEHAAEPLKTIDIPSQVAWMDHR